MLLRVRLLASLLLAYGVAYVALAILLSLFIASRPDLLTPVVRCLLPPAEFILGSASAAAGLGLFRSTPWARALSILVALVSLAFVPLGTFFGVFALWALSTTKQVSVVASDPRSR
jgi:hypothetical protein